LESLQAGGRRVVVTRGFDRQLLTDEIGRHGIQWVDVQRVVLVKWHTVHEHGGGIGVRRKDCARFDRLNRDAQLLIRRERYGLVGHDWLAVETGV